MKKNFIFNVFAGLTMLGLQITSTHAQIWQNSGANISGVVFNPKIVVSHDTVFIAYLNSMNNQVEMRKQVGNTWELLGSLSSKDGVFDLELGSDGLPILATVSSSLNSSNQDFNLVLHKYDAPNWFPYGGTSLGSGPNTNNVIDIFDFATHPGLADAFGVIFRFNNSYQTIYKGKIGGVTQATWSDSYFVLAPGGNSGVKNARLVYTNSNPDAFIVSRNQTTFGGVVDAVVIHVFKHSIFNENPIEIVPPSISSSTIIESNIALDSYGNDVYAVLTNSSFLSTVYKINYAGGSLGLSAEHVMGTNQLFPLIKIDQATGDIFMAYSEEEGTTAPGKVSKFDNDFDNETVLGGVKFNDVGNMVGEMSLALNGSEAYVFFQYGPPFNNAKVRKFACPTEVPTVVFNETTGVLSATGSFVPGDYEWINCANENVVATTSTFEPTTDGDYALIVSYGDCEVISECVNVTLDNDPGVGIDDASLNGLKLYPNPISMSSEKEINLINAAPNSTFSIIDQTGRVVYKATSSNENKINITNLESGVYFVRATNQNGTAETLRVVIAK